MALDENINYAQKINELVASNNDLRLEVLRLQDVIRDIQGESILRLLFAAHLRRMPPLLPRRIKPMDVPPIIPAVEVPAPTQIPRRAKRVGE